jgi:type IV pilus assembly protein PilB
MSKTTSQRHVSGAVRARLGESLVEAGLIDHDALRKALVVQKGNKKKLGETLVEIGAITAADLRTFLAQRLGVPPVDLESTYGDATIVDVIPKPEAFRHNVLPLYVVDDEVTVAMGDPSDLAKLEELKFITGKRIFPVLALEREIQAQLPVYYGEKEGESEAEAIRFETGDDDDDAQRDSVQLDVGEKERPAVRVVNLILARAVQEQASDVHLEPQEKSLAVRFRIDGRLQPKPFSIPAPAIPVIVSRMKVLARIDISERRIPQDGKVRVVYRGRRVDVRVSTFPTIHGEKIVLRLLDKDRQQLDLDNIGMSPGILERFRELLQRHEGILLVTGPTGSGKSSTLYAGLKALNQPDVNIVTLEDPVEYELPGISQGQVNTKSGFTFAAGLRSILRQDPDIILVGEIRDAETARIAMQAALTGHLVLATLHTNDAPGAIARLVDMGVPRFLVAASVVGILAQRLVRRVCPKCATELEPSAEEALVRERLGLGDVPHVDGRGCSACLQIGYKGRTGVHELAIVTSETQRLVAEGCGERELHDAFARDGYRPMWNDGLEKVRAGITTVREVSESVGLPYEPGEDSSTAESSR